MKAKNGGRGMTDEQVYAFVERYMPGYELWKEGIWSNDAPWAGRALRMYFGRGREVIRIAKPAITESKDTEVFQSTTVLERATTSLDRHPVKPSESRDIPPPSSPSGASTLLHFNPDWSRKFLTSRSPLIPTYDQIPPVATLHPDSLIMKTTPHLALFPLQGPGGRLAIHPLKKKGRVRLGGEGYLSGGVGITDFAVENFVFEGGSRVALAGEDGVIRVWRVDQDGKQGARAEAAQVLRGEKSV